MRTRKPLSLSIGQVIQISTPLGMISIDVRPGVETVDVRIVPTDLKVNVLLKSTTSCRTTRVSLHGPEPK